MKFKFKTREQLLATGWNPRAGYPSGSLFCDDDGPDFWVREMDYFLGTEIDLTQEQYDRLNTARYFIHPDGWGITAGMLLAARCKTEEQLRESGWSYREEYASYYAPVEHPSHGHIGIGRLQVPHLVGKLLPIHGLVVRGNNFSELLIQEPIRHLITQPMLVDSPTVRLVFDADSTPTAVPEDEPEPSFTPPPLDEAPEKPEIEAFRSASFDQARSLVTCGFELETQATEGHTWEGLEHEEFDEDGYYEAVDERVSEILGEVDEYVGGSLLDRVRAAIRERVIEHDEIERSDYCSGGGGENPAAYMEENYVIPERVEVGDDGSVAGFEFRTEGPQTYDQFVEAAQGIFKLNHRIDTGCSFHVHVQVKGVQHVYGDRFQRALTEFLIENISRVPASVRERWAGIENNTYIQPGGGKAKYSFVHKHRQGTWEFRCFGNVRNAADAQVCLDLAVQAMQYAYRVRDGQVKLVSERAGSLDIHDWAYLCRLALSKGTPLTAVLAEQEQAA